MSTSLDTELLERLHKLYAQLDERMRSEHQRSFGLEELLSDRWQRAEKLGFASGASIYASCAVFGEVVVGEKSWIGPGTILDGSGGQLTIGSFCNISAGAQIYTHDTVQWCLSGGKAKARREAVSIGDCTYIGPNVVVQAGVSIGDHCVIGANALVNRSVPPYSFACGNPCRVVGRVVEDHDGNFEIKDEADGS